MSESTSTTGWVTMAGGSLRRVSLDQPVPGPGQVAVAARAWAFNNADLDIASEEHLAGYEFSGDVIAVGPDVDPDLVGQRVMGTTPGAFAEVVLAHRRHVLPVPESVSDEDAAALPTALLTERGALTVASHTPGRSVLVTAGTSSIGLIGIQMAKVLGATRVIATTRSAARGQILAEVGADVVVSGDLVAEVLAATDGDGVDVVLDHVGGDTFAQTVEATRRGGVVVNVGRLAGTRATVDLTVLARRQVTLRSVSFGFADPEMIGQIIDGLADDVMPAVADGRIRAVVDSVGHFDDAPAALDRLRTGTTTGKVVLTASR